MRFAHYKVGFFTITPLLNQPSVAVCTDFTVYEEARGLGLSATLKQLQIKSLITLGYSKAICTVQSDNFRQIKVLEKAGWRQVDSFKDLRTGLSCYIFSINVSSV